MKNKNKTRKSRKPQHEHPLPGEISSKQKKENTDAFREADSDMKNDPEFSAHNKNDDLDEGESARLGEDDSDLV